MATAAGVFSPRPARRSFEEPSHFQLMNRCQRMKHGCDFASLRKHGRSQASRYLVLSTLNAPDRTGESPFLAGFITSKRVGIAVVRNRVRRRLRAIIDEFADRLVPGTMLVIIARYRAPEAPYATLRADWERLAKRAGILKRLQTEKNHAL